MSSATTTACRKNNKSAGVFPVIVQENANHAREWCNKRVDPMHTFSCLHDIGDIHGFVASSGGPSIATFLTLTLRWKDTCKSTPKKFQTTWLNDSWILSSSLQVSGLVLLRFDRACSELVVVLCLGGHTSHPPNDSADKCLCQLALKCRSIVSVTRQHPPDSYTVQVERVMPVQAEDTANWLHIKDLYWICQNPSLVWQHRKTGVDMCNKNVHV